MFNLVVATPVGVGSFAFSVGPRELLIKIFMVTSIFYISYVEPLFVVAKIIDHVTKMIAYFFIHNCFKCDYDHYKALSVIMTITKF